MGRAGLLRLSKEGPTGCKPTPIMFLGNTVQSVRTFIQTRTCTRVTCTQAPQKDLYTLIQVDPMAAAWSSPPRPNPQARSSPRPEAGPALPQLPHAGPASLQLGLTSFVPFLGPGRKQDSHSQGQKRLPCSSLWQFLPFPCATAHWPLQVRILRPHREVTHLRRPSGGLLVRAQNLTRLRSSLA